MSRGVVDVVPSAQVRSAVLSVQMLILIQFFVPSSSGWPRCVHTIRSPGYDGASLVWRRSRVDLTLPLP